MLQDDFCDLELLCSLLFASPLTFIPSPIEKNASQGQGSAIHIVLLVPCDGIEFQCERD